MNYESTEFIKCLLDSMLNFSIFYIASNNYEVAYKYAYQLNQMSYNFDESTVNNKDNFFFKKVIN